LKTFITLDSKLIRKATKEEIQMQKRGESTGNQEKTNEKKLEEKEKEIKEKENKIEEKENKIEEKEKEIKEKELEFLTLKLELNSLSNDNQKSIHSEKLKYLERTISDLRRQLDRLNEDRSDLRMQLDRLNEEKNNLLTDKRILQSRIETFITEKSEILKTLKGLEALEKPFAGMLSSKILPEQETLFFISFSSLWLCVGSISYSISFSSIL